MVKKSKKLLTLSLTAMAMNMCAMCMMASAQQIDEFPLEENEYLILTTGAEKYSWLGGDMVLILDSDGNEVARLPGYGLIGNGGSMSRGLVLEETTPLQVFKNYSDETENKSDAVSAEAGLYSLVNFDWIEEPSPKFLTILSDKLYMDGDMVGGLYNIDGACIKEEPDKFVRYGNYIIDSETVYDVNGEELIKLNDLKFRALIDDGLLLIGYHDDGTHWTQLSSIDNIVIWTEDTGLIWNGVTGIYSSWMTSEGKGRILTNDNLEIIMTEEDFIVKNTEVQGSSMYLAAMKKTENNEQQFFIRMMDNIGNSWFYLCDSDFIVKESYPQNQVYWNESDGQLWYWSFDEKVGSVKNLLTGSEMNWEYELCDEVNADLYQVEVMQAGNTMGIIYKNASGNGETFVCGIDDDVLKYTDETDITARMTFLNDETVEVYVLKGAYTEHETSQIVYYQPDGTLMETSDAVLFRNQTIRCIQLDDKIEIQDAKGNVIKVVN